ncbi:serine palmitoyltransferase small subunit A-like [Amphiura filiformis]|uniref:serine palmitoyltransferase small subunit A-like n=1 Tax=Amphiura filiformis TaxID=82378 RepID=UPI003B212F31
MAKKTDNLGLFQRMKVFLIWLWQQYTFCTAVYMLEPVEAAIFNIVVFLIFFTSCYTAYIFLPPHCHMILQYLGFIDIPDAGKTPLTSS